MARVLNFHSPRAVARTESESIEPTQTIEPARTDGTSALAATVNDKSVDAIWHQAVVNTDAKEKHLDELLERVRDYALCKVQSWDEAFLYKWDILDNKASNWHWQLEMYQQFNTQKALSRESIERRIAGLKVYLDKIKQARQIYNAEMESVRPLVEQAHARAAAQIEAELGLADLAAALRADDPVSWLDSD